MFGPWQGQTLTMQSAGHMPTAYIGHCDPSVSGANFAMVIGHREGPDAEGRHHAVIDHVQVWQPADFPGHRISYETVEREILILMTRFPMTQLSFDQFNSAGIIERLQRFAASGGLTRRTSVVEFTATAPRNLRLAETFKTALQIRLVHSPYHRLAEQELLFLVQHNRKVDHPRSGPVQTADVADSYFEITYQLLGDQCGLGAAGALSGLSPRASQAGGFPLSVPDPIGMALSEVGRSSRDRALTRRASPGQARARGYRF